MGHMSHLAFVKRILSLPSGESERLEQNRLGSSLEAGRATGQQVLVDTGAGLAWQ